MLVDENNKFITQQFHPEMALLKVEINNDLLTIEHKQNNLSPLTVQPFPNNADEINVQKLVKLLQPQVNDYSKDELVMVMNEKGYGKMVIAEVLKRIGK